MPVLALTDSQHARPRLDLPAVRMVNAYLESSPGGPSELVRTSRPGLTERFNIGAGPILRSFQKPGLFNNAVFNVSGGELYGNGDLLGPIAYSYAPRFASSDNYLALVSGGALYVFHTGSLNTIPFFDDGVSGLPGFSSTAVLYNIWVYPVAGSNQVFFSAVGDPTSINAANYFSAQVSPTPIVEVAVLAEELYFFKTDTVEIWDFTGSLTAPFAESPGRTYSRGCVAQNSVCQLDNSLFWVGDDLTVYRTGTVPQRVSTSLIEDRLKAIGQNDIANITALTFNIEGHVFYVLNMPTLGQGGESYAYDCQTQKWFQWGTQQPLLSEPGVWVGQTATGQGNTIYVGSNTDGTVYEVNVRSHMDGDTPMRVVVSGAHWVNEGVTRANNLALQMVRGVATTQIPDPIVQMRWSEDGGQTWTSWMIGSIGPVGGYRWKVSWHSLGLIEQPGREFEFAITDAVNVTLESATLNPARR